MWSSGRHEDAINLYLHLPTSLEGLVSIQEGSLWDQVIEKSIREEKKLPKEFGGLLLNDPKPKLKIETPFGENYILVGELDCLDIPIIYEFKTGKSSATEYASSWQIPIYFLLTHLEKIPVERAMIIHYNQHKKETEWVLLQNNEVIRNTAINVIETLGPEIYDYFEREGIMERRDRISS